MEDKSAEWNKLVGKKILVYDPDLARYSTFRGKKIHIMRIEGCDPHVGICIAYLDGDIFWVSHGKLSPKMKELGLDGCSKGTLNMLYDQIRSGYFSVPVLEKYLHSIGRHVGHGANCPFSM